MFGLQFLEIFSYSRATFDAANTDTRQKEAASCGGSLWIGSYDRRRAGGIEANVMLARSPSGIPGHRPSPAQRGQPNP